MKFTCTVTINLPKEKVAKLFADPKYLKEYQEGFEKKELISGKHGQVGAISNLYYKTKKNSMELKETILVNNLPHEFIGRYHHKFTDNTMKSTFISLDDNVTRYDAEIHYTEFRGVPVKIMKFLFPSFFKKQVDKWLTNFKIFAEKQ